MSINLLEAFENTFGYRPPVTQQPQIPNAVARQAFGKKGTPYVSVVNGVEHYQPVIIDDMVIPFAVVSQTWGKTIVRTPMPERGGSVKEQVAKDDYLFSIKGIIISQTRDFPEAEFERIKQLWDKDQSVTLRNVLTDYVLTGRSSQTSAGIAAGAEGDPNGFKVLISKITWPAMPGVEHARAFDMEVESDFIYDLEMD